MNPLNLLNSLISLSWLAVSLSIVILLLPLFSSKEIAKRPSIDLSTDALKQVDHNTTADPRLAMGKSLFKSNCAQCHNKNLTEDMTGPALKGTLERWADYPKEDLYNWIRYSQKLISQKHPRALVLWTDWKPAVMNDFPNLMDEEIEELLLFIGS